MGYLQRALLHNTLIYYIVDSFVYIRHVYATCISKDFLYYCYLVNLEKVQASVLRLWMEFGQWMLEIMTCYPLLNCFVKSIMILKTLLNTVPFTIFELTFSVFFRVIYLITLSSFAQYIFSSIFDTYMRLVFQRIFCTTVYYLI